MMDTLKDGSIFMLTKVTFADEKAEYVGAPPLQICIDLRKAKCAAILYSLVTMPPVPAPAEDLAGILCLGSRRRVDLTALIVDVSAPRRHTTANSMKDITDKTVVDGSTSKGEAQQVSAEISMFLDAHAKIAALLQRMQEAHIAKSACHDV